MLTEKEKKLISEIINSKSQELTAQIHTEKSQCLGDLNKRGMLNSGARTTLLGQIDISGAKRYGNIVFEAFEKILKLNRNIIDVDADIDLVKNEITKFISPYQTTLNSSEGVSNASHHTDLVIKEINLKIDVLFMELKDMKLRDRDFKSVNGPLASSTTELGIKTVFVSHSSQESELAAYIANWFENTSSKKIKCFCSSRPDDLPPGEDWLKEIHDRSKGSNFCLLLISPESSKSDWIYYEAGLVFGANSKNKVIPVLYGGMGMTNLSKTLRHIQVLSLQDEAQFDAFVSKNFSEEINHGHYKNFIGEMPELLKRQLSYGPSSLLIKKQINTMAGFPRTITSEKDLLKIDRNNDLGELSSVRILFMPRRINHIQHWKIGLNIKNQGTQVFHFHAGCHLGLNSWTIYFSHFVDHPVNQPAHLETEKECGLQMWFDEKRNFVKCVGIDSDGKKISLSNDRNEELWPLTIKNWDEIEVCGWADDQKFQVDLLNLEIDRSK